VVANWLGGKLDLRKTIREELPGLRAECPILFTAHHQAHAASAFYPSPFTEAAILTIDAVGEWATTTIGRGRGDAIELLQELRFPHSLGMLYSAFTDYCGFRINSGEYKLMGLAPYGEPIYAETILRELLDLKPDGSFWMNLDCFNFLRGTTMTNARFHRLFGGPPRRPDEAIEQRHMHIARSIQVVTEEVVLRLARHARALTGEKHLCLAGGVALNCVANGRLLREGIFEHIWIQPAASDAGGALGAALAAWHTERNDAGSLPKKIDAMRGSLLGPEYSDEEIEATLRSHGATFQRLHTTDDLLKTTVELLQAGKVVGWVQGRMEFGPRALGNRSILASPLDPYSTENLNVFIKHREPFRKFAASVPLELAAEYFDAGPNARTIATVGRVREAYKKTFAPAILGDDMVRVHTVDAAENPLFHRLLHEAGKASGLPVLYNTSFNLFGDPLVSTPRDAVRSFYSSGIDVLFVGNFLLEK
jgi:carbamoyltransferase